ncbi:caffeic acid 3-O-methyltransferase-like [Diospyros lotus]|uniref:caffeic acid 3-O-methyltransferase-like n=1 Tax=Diospyros lotus TaxID=55363 RepID=UPI00225852D8|nr:caffeic acid 3-O-methyltransferase-like [Diospyros lotus]
MEASANGGSAADAEELQHCSYAMQLASSMVLPMVLQAAVKLEVLEIIAKAGGGAQLSASEIAAQMPTCRNPEAPDLLDRMLRLLVSHSVLTCSMAQGGPRFYGLAPVAKYFVRNQDGASFGPMLSLIQDEICLASWFHLKATILDGGIPFKRAHGMDAFDYICKDQRFSDVVNEAMLKHTTISMKKILQSYKGFEQLTEVVDVGGGLGITLRIITSKYPHINGFNFDLPQVIQHAPAYPGVEHVGGNMFESVPKGEAIILKWILHDWSDEHCLKLLKNCYKALPDGGKVIVVEGILPTTPDASAATIANYGMDLVMMTQNHGGKERTQEEFLALATGAGFSGIRLECFAANFWVMEFYM